MGACGDACGLNNYPIAHQSTTRGHDAERSIDSRTRAAQCLSEAQPLLTQVSPETTTGCRRCERMAGAAARRPPNGARAPRAQ